jgi:murein L,D-transpeptidase YcbB/YkuD
LAPQTATAATTAAFVSAPVSADSVDAFYAARDYRPLWLDDRGRFGVAPRILLDLFDHAEADGLNPADYRLRNLDRALGAARSGRPRDVLSADRMLSLAFAAYVRDLKRQPNIPMIWVDPELRPAAPSPRQLLDSAAAAPSLETYLAEMRWMNPIYSGLRQAMVRGVGGSPAEQDLVRLNLERARALPGGTGRYIIVNAAAARLTMHENGKVVDSMRVVVGKPVNQTPMMAALIRFTSLNPYWNVPPDLTAERIAPNVVKGGTAYLKAKGYQLLSSWKPDADVIDPTTVDWQEVAAGRQEIRVRQLPGPANAMGKMKFMFPNAQGIYLHDTPDKELLTEASRMFSGGCVRLEDAPRLARWLYNGDVPTTKSARPEQRLDLPQPVPVFLTYLTAMPSDGEIAFLPDVYNRDQPALATLNGRRSLATR